MQLDLMTKNLKLEHIELSSVLTSPKNILLLCAEPISKDYHFRIYVGEITEEEATAIVPVEICSRMKNLFNRGLTPILSNTGMGFHFSLNSVNLVPDSPPLSLDFTYVDKFMKLEPEINKEKALDILLGNKEWQYITEMLCRVWLVEGETIGLQFACGDNNWGRRTTSPMYISVSPICGVAPAEDGKSCRIAHAIYADCQYPPKTIQNLRIHNFNNFQI